jgi:predicted dehydrogenase
MSGKLRVAILGAGLAGEGHIRAYKRQPDVKVVALWSRTRSRAETLLKRIEIADVAVYDHWQDLVEKADFDILSLAASPALRLEPFRMALARGSHVLVEKPIEIGLDNSIQMIKLGRTTALVTATCFNWRYAPGYKCAWREVQNGRIGQIRDLKSEWRLRMVDRGFFAQRPWALHLDVGDGTLGEGLGHDLDKARFLSGGDFKAIVSRIAPYEILQDHLFKVDAGSQVHIAEMSGGVIGTFRFTLTAGQPEWSLLLNGDKGTLSVTNESLDYHCAEDLEPTRIDIPEGDRIPDGVSPMQHTWNLLIADFVAAVQAGDAGHSSVPHLPTLEDGLRVQETIAAARRSEEERRWVRIDELA